MKNSLSLSTNLFETLSVLSSFKLTESIWDSYESFAISKISDSTLKLRGAMHYLKELTPSQAAKELKLINNMMPIIQQLNTMILKVNHTELAMFKNEVAEFIETIEHLRFQLNEIKDEQNSYLISSQVLEQDWLREEDNHWDNY